MHVSPLASLLPFYTPRKLNKKTSCFCASNASPDTDTTYSQCADGRGLEDGWAGEGEGCDGTDTGAVRALLAADGSLSVWGAVGLRTLLTRSVKRDTGVCRCIIAKGR